MNLKLVGGTEFTEHTRWMMNMTSSPGFHKGQEGKHWDRASPRDMSSNQLGQAAQVRSISTGLQTVPSLDWVPLTRTWLGSALCFSFALVMNLI